jgi:hypothetical protein
MGHRRGIVTGVGRLFLAAWLALFAIQSSDLLAAVVPDDCVEETRGSAADPCSENCARCVCCARIPVFVPQALVPTPTDALTVADAQPPLAPSTTAAPRGVFQVPKTL